MFAVTTEVAPAATAIRADADRVRRRRRIGRHGGGRAGHHRQPGIIHRARIVRVAHLGDDQITPRVRRIRRSDRAGSRSRH
jgi:hypothetical protein